MWMNCHKGFKHRNKIGNVVMEDIRVNVCAGICDSCDLCGITDCEFYDNTPAGTRLFLQANAHEHTLEGLMQKKNLKSIFAD